MRKLLFLTAFAIFGCICNAQTVSDIDGNVYNTVTIGTQTWMVENLATTKYNDGTNILLVTSATVWNDLTTEAYCWYKNDTNQKATYGALYNWYTVHTSKLCPVDWHVPSDGEWKTLSNYLGGGAAGGKLKESGTAHWTSPNTGANNSSGFTALPGGGIFKDETYLDMGNYGFWWSSSGSSTTMAWYRYMYFSDNEIHEYSHNKSDGFSVRCVHDNASYVSKNQANRTKVFLNRSGDKLFIENNSLTSSVEIFNLEGKVLKKDKIQNSVDISDLKAGIYIAKITGNELISFSKFLKK